jgi:hypothetical protein
LDHLAWAKQAAISKLKSHGRNQAFVRIQGPV